MEDFIRYLLTPLLSEPDGLEITTQPGAIVVKVSEADTGRIIGKQGNVINSIRILLKTFCAVRQLPPTNLILNTPPPPVVAQS